MHYEKNPTTGIAGCCARAASGHAAAAPPSSVMNWRRLISDMGLPPSLLRNTGHDTSKRPPRPRPPGGPLVRSFASPIVHLLVKRAEYHAAIVLDDRSVVATGDS
jgi:hypothetical protein